MCTIAANALFLATGIAVGQRAGVSKFEKYLRPAAPTEMDWITLQDNVGSIRASLPYDELSVRKTYSNHKTNRLETEVIISDDFAKAPLETVKTQILGCYLAEYHDLKSAIPELSEDDFVLTVFIVESHFRVFAECRHKNIVFH
jgi:hypothetical protein